MKNVIITLTDNTKIQTSDDVKLDDLEQMLEQFNQYVLAVQGTAEALRDIKNARADVENAQMQQANFQHVVDGFHVYKQSCIENMHVEDRAIDEDPWSTDPDDRKCESMEDYFKDVDIGVECNPVVRAC